MQGVIIFLVLGAIMMDLLLFAATPDRPLKWYEYLLFGSIIKLHIDIYKQNKNDQNKNKKSEKQK